MECWMSGSINTITVVLKLNLNSVLCDETNLAKLHENMLKFQKMCQVSKLLMCKFNHIAYHTINIKSSSVMYMTTCICILYAFLLHNLSIFGTNISVYNNRNPCEIS